MNIKYKTAIACVIVLMVALAYLIGSVTTGYQLDEMYNTINKDRSMVRVAYQPIIKSTIDYYYHGSVVNVVDGDTLDIRLDLGFNLFSIKRFRLSGINAPEMSDDPNGPDSKNIMKELVLGKEVIVNTYHDNTDKYGRFLATIFSDDGQVNFNEKMVELGKAAVY